MTFSKASLYRHSSWMGRFALCVLLVLALCARASAQDKKAKLEKEKKYVRERTGW